MLINYKKYSLEEMASTYATLFGQYIGFHCTRDAKEIILYSEILICNLFQLRKELEEVKILGKDIDEMEKTLIPELSDYLPTTPETVAEIYTEYLRKFSLFYPIEN